MTKSSYVKILSFNWHKNQKFLLKIVFVTFYGIFYDTFTTLFWKLIVTHGIIFEIFYEATNELKISEEQIVIFFWLKTFFLQNTIRKTCLLSGF